MKTLFLACIRKQSVIHPSGVQSNLLLYYWESRPNTTDKGGNVDPTFLICHSDKPTNYADRVIGTQKLTYWGNLYCKTCLLKTIALMNMKTLRLILAPIAAMLLCCTFLCSCVWNKKPYKVYWSGNNLYMEMQRPTVGVVGINQIDWGDVRLSEVMEDVLKAVKEKDSYSSEFHLYARLTCNPKDKYGNSTERQDDYLVETIEFAEAKKYQTAQSFNGNYGITYKIEEIVRPTRNSGGFHLGR